jgi:hypothetical protein
MEKLKVDFSRPRQGDENTRENEIPHPTRVLSDRMGGMRRGSFGAPSEQTIYHHVPCASEMKDIGARAIRTCMHTYIRSIRLQAASYHGDAVHAHRPAGHPDVSNRRRD